MLRNPYNVLIKIFHPVRTPGKRPVALLQAGDTIVEVLIAIATVSAVLGAAYVSANRSLQASRQSQERGEAIRIAESQAEQIKVLARNSGGGIFTSPYVFCIAFAAPNMDQKQSFSSSGPFSTALDSDNFSSYPGNCKQGLYNVGIKYNQQSPAGTLNDSFTILVRWNRLGGSNDEVRMDYRLN